MTIHIDNSNAELSAAERQKLLVEWNNTQANYLKEKCTSQPFEKKMKTISGQTIKHYPLSSPQLDFWFDQIRHPEIPLYNIGGYVRIEGPIEPSLFEQALNQVIETNDALRIVLHESKSLPTQTFAEHVNIKLDFHDFSETENAHKSALQWMKQAFIKPFQLYNEHLFHFALCKVEANCYYWFKKYHHLIVDGWAISLIVQRVAAAYNALMAGATDEPQLYSYQDFIQNDQAYLESEKFVQAQRYWQDKYRQVPESLWVRRYASQFPGKTIPSQRATLCLKRSFYNQLNEFAQKNKVSTFHVILGALYCYLVRTGHREDLSIGLFTHNRNTVAFKQTVGLFVSTSPAWFRFGTDLNFVELVQKINQELHRDYRHQRFPLSKITQPVRLYSNQLLFDLELSYAKHDYDVHFNDNPSRTRYLHHGFGQDALAVFIEEFHQQNDVNIYFDYNLDFFDAAEIEHLKAHFELLLGEIHHQPEVPIRALPIMPKAKLNQIFLEGNHTATDYPSDKTVIDRFEEQVARTPSAIAVIFKNQSLTYSELNSKANQLAHYLQNGSLKSDEPVGLCVEASLEMIIGLLGILKAGGAYVPLDPHYPPERLAFMLSNAQVNVLLTQQQWLRQLPQLEQSIFCLDSDWADIAQSNPNNPPRLVQPSRLIYLIYTSGSTGQPKGVEIEHRGFSNLVNWLVTEFNLTATDRVLVISSFSFDLTQKNFFAPLIVGGQLHLSSPELYDPQAILQTVYEQQITWLNCTPSAFYPLGEFDESHTFQRLASLRYVFLGGEPIFLTRLWSWLQSNAGQAKLVNTYGPTECTDVSAAYLLEQPESFLEQPIPIGKPIFNVKLFILGQHLDLLPVGVVGELHIGGVGLARGYLNRPDLTAEKFIPNPFDEDPRSRLYKTGDLARYLSDGNIEYLGRVDNQVKINGFRVELGEIEIAITQHPWVRQAVVIVWQVHVNDQRLVAYFISNQEDIVSALADELPHFLKERLPAYMIPVAFIPLSQIPLTPNGKLDRHRLPTPDPFQIKNKEKFIAPRTAAETALADIWADVLEHENIGIHDDFFELGGHSLLATQVISRIRDTFEIELPQRKLFECPTIASLSKQLTMINQESRLPPITLVNRDKFLPLSFAQQRLWFLEQLESQSATYNLPIAFHLEGQLHQQALEHSFQTLIWRHESLRTTFPTQNGTPFVQISDKPFRLAILDLRTLPLVEQELAVQRLLKEEVNCPFNLEIGPLFRVLLFQLGTTSHILLINIHHIISDGWSLGVFAREFGLIYKATLKGQLSPLPPLPIQYVDFAHWQRQWLTGEVLDKQLKCWKQQLAQVPTLLNLPTDYPRPPRQRFYGASLSVSLSTELTDQLKQLSQQMGTTLFMTLWSAFAILLSRYSGQTDIVIGSPIANRNHTQTESLIGFFVNTLVLRLDLSKNPRFHEMLGQARRVALEAYNHQDIPFEQLVEALQPERHLSHSPLFQVMFVLQNTEQPDLELVGLSLTPLALETATAQFDLTLELTETTAGLTGRLEYNTDLFERTTIERLSGHLQTLLMGIVDNPNTPIHELPLLTQAEQQQLLAWNDTATDYPQDKCIHQLFEAQVEKTPDAIAVVFEAQQLTYRELNTKANQLAPLSTNFRSQTGSLGRYLR